MECGNAGCGKTFNPEDNSETSCCYHPGKPVFHDTARGYTCCPRRVYDFDSFMGIAGCSIGPHIVRAPKTALTVEPTATDATTVSPMPTTPAKSISEEKKAATVSATIQKCYVHFEEAEFTSPIEFHDGSTVGDIKASFLALLVAAAPPGVVPVDAAWMSLTKEGSKIRLQDSQLAVKAQIRKGTDLYCARVAPASAPSRCTTGVETPAAAAVGAAPPLDPDIMRKCAHHGCNGTEYRERENHDAACRFHPGAPIFHEGSQGYSCCPKRAMAFDDFLRIDGCKIGRHSDVREAPTASLVLSSVAAYTWEQTDKEVSVRVPLAGRSKKDIQVDFEDCGVMLTVALATGKNYVLSLDPLFAAIKSAKCSVKCTADAVVVRLVKEKASNWAKLEG